MRNDQDMAPFLSPNVLPEQLDVVRVFLYARQSKARQDASEASPEAQLNAGHALVASRSASSNGRPWRVTGEFKDVGKSGWDPNVVRPDFEAMMDAVRCGECDVVVVNELSRLTRQGAYEAMKIDQELRKYGVRLISVQEPFLDTSNPIGEAIFALIAALAKQDSDIKAARTAGAKEEIQAVGGRHSSSPPFGMKTRREVIGKLTVNTLEPNEETWDKAGVSPAFIVRTLVSLAMDGHAYNKIAAIMDDRGVPAPGAWPERNTEARQKAVLARGLAGRQRTGIVWRAQTVRSILTHPCIGGFASTRAPKGPKGTLYNVIARDESGQPLTPHEGVITGPEWLRLQEVIAQGSASTRKGVKRHGKSTPTLLSGWKFTTCGLCEGSMGKSGAYYMCANPINHGGLSVQIEHLDKYVAGKVWAKIAEVDLTDPDDRMWLIAAAARFAKQADLAGVDEERAETAAHLEHVRKSIDELYKDRETLYRGERGAEAFRATMQQYQAYEDTCVAKLRELDEKTADRIRIPAEWFTGGTDPLGPESDWAAWDVFKQRSFLELFLKGVSVGPGRRDDKSVIPVAERVRLDWRSAPSAEEVEIIMGRAPDVTVPSVSLTDEQQEVPA